MNFLKKFLYVLLLFNTLVFAADTSLKPAITQPIPILEIKDFSQYPKVVKDLILEANILSNKNLTYLYGSSEPTNKGMDCSGTIYYLLSRKLKNVPRSSEEMFQWIKKEGHLHLVDQQDFSSRQFSDLKPGDLLFWSGTYSSKNYITHVMLYLGKNVQNQPLMFGASDGRTYQGKKMWGVSVFDFKLPFGKSGAKFVGYSCIPNLTCLSL